MVTKPLACNKVTGGFYFGIVCLFAVVLGAVLLIQWQNVVVVVFSTNCPVSDGEKKKTFDVVAHRFVQRLLFSLRNAMECWLKLKPTLELLLNCSCQIAVQTAQKCFKVHH